MSTAPVPSLLDRAMDFAIVPGFSSIGYRIRSRGWSDPAGLEGHSVLLTGASSGLGAAACEILAEAGATVHMLVRDEEKGEDVRARLSERTGSDSLRLWTCDVSDLDSVRDFAARFIAEVPTLDALVHNAGVMPPERTHTEQGIELTFATNVAGPFLLTALLLPVLEAAPAGRVVNVSSGGMYGAKLTSGDPQLPDREFDGTRFYAHTKRCEVVLTELWQEREGDSGVTFHSTHPGWANTPGITDSLPGFAKVVGPILRDAREGADTTAWLSWAPEPLEQPAAFWHDRQPRPKYRLPRTKEDPAARLRLWEECERLTSPAREKVR